MPDFLTLYAAAQPDKPAVIDDRPDGTVTTLTYAELEDRANRLANVLLKLGITAVPLNYRLSDEEAQYVTDHCDASIVYCDVEQAPMFERIRAGLPQVEHYLVFAAGDATLPDGMTDVDAQMV